MKLPSPAKVLRRISPTWCFCVMVITVLALFITGHSLFGLSKYISIGMALLGVLLAPFLTALIFPFITFIMTALITPLIALLMASLTALGSALTFLITPLLTALGSLWAWFLGTAVGQAIVAPLYSFLAPLVIKIAPFLTTSRYAGKIFKLLRKSKVFAPLAGLLARHRQPRSK